MWRTSTSERIRDEAPGDEGPIAQLTVAAFAEAPHSDGREAAVIGRLRDDRDLALSLVAEADGCVVGHAAFSPVTIDGRHGGWFGLGPVSVRPEYQRRGIGAAMIGEGLARLRDMGAQGCVVLGDPAFYGRFGFVADPDVRYPGPPPEFFQRLTFMGTAPRGIVAYAPAFNG